MVPLFAGFLSFENCETLDRAKCVFVVGITKEINNPGNRTNNSKVNSVWAKMRTFHLHKQYNFNSDIALIKGAM